jgi:membrane fusion protein (multidrug efflux system)
MAFLFKEGAISESQYDAAKTEFEVNKASFEAVSRMVDVQSPISGVVTAINVSEGEYVAVGQKLATVAATDKLRVKLSVNPDEVSLFDIGSQVTVHADAAGDAARGRVVAIASSADPVTRAFEIEALIDNSQGHFRPGMFVTVDFIQENLEDVIVVPRPAVLNLDDRWSVFVVENGVARKRLVELGSEVDGHIVIKSGLAVGDTLVVLGQDYIEDGFAVNVSSLDEGV